jgi:hypothetical protein
MEVSGQLHAPAALPPGYILWKKQWKTVLLPKKQYEWKHSKDKIWLWLQMNEVGVVSLRKNYLLFSTFILLYVLFNSEATLYKPS